MHLCLWFDVLCLSPQVSFNMYNNSSGGGKPRGFGFGGFSIGSSSGSSSSAPFRKKGTGIETQMAQVGYGMGAGMAGRSYGGHMNIGKRRVKSEEELVHPLTGSIACGFNLVWISHWDFRYFEDDEEANADELEYQPAPDSPVLHRDDGNAGSNDDSDDPLDAFMAGIEVVINSLILFSLIVADSGW